MESCSSVSIQSLFSISVNTTDLILPYYQDLLASKSIFQISEPTLINGKLIELNFKSIVDADFCEICEKTDIISSINIPHAKFRKGENYSLRAAVGVIF